MVLSFSYSSEKNLKITVALFFPYQKCFYKFESNDLEQFNVMLKYLLKENIKLEASL
ncbi:hypothetical protein OCHUTO_1121 [Orientia chuto str. Dubai]|uniref:Uncharacterized protein n=1 Tax=Orientia chuto str. Dubai TaxID=1359168 RepID=A0A0F3MG05_9RICK|nr:hypothetical protein OCHUTO_1121 [Orientia chuto str. Dubai]